MKPTVCQLTNARQPFNNQGNTSYHGTYKVDISVHPTEDNPCFDLLAEMPIAMSVYSNQNTNSNNNTDVALVLMRSNKGVAATFL